MFESGDGGLYGERTSAALNAWTAINGATLSVIAESTRVSSALPNALHVVFPSGRTGPVGFANGGYFGIKVTTSTTYSASFFYRFPTSSSFRGTATLSLQTTSGTILGSSSVSISGAQTSWQQLTVQITPTVAPSSGSTANRFVLSLDGAAAAGQTINFAMLSLFPPTFKGRVNGMREDIAEALVEMGPSFFRFPGGNNLEGQTVAQRWQWNATIHTQPLRKAASVTGATPTQKYLNWCEDSGMEPIMAIWSGFALGGTSVAEAALAPYIQQAAAQVSVERAMPVRIIPIVGLDSFTEGFFVYLIATLRASLGHPEPFKLTYVEVGNEDNFAATSYIYRWKDFVNTLKSQFPQLHFIATTSTSSPVLSPVPTEYDVHVYQTPTWFAQNSFFYDGFQRNGQKYFEGEYAAISTNSSNIFGAIGTGRLSFPTMQSSSGEAAFMTGLERNSDIVFAASYAPLLNHVSNSQWTPNLVSF
ncbi:hypothetical protein DXG01_007228, partial [Tephrocybe rancida]